MRHLRYIPLFIVVLMTACQATRNRRAPQREVPMAINIRMDNNATINFVNTNFFRFELLREFEQFQAVNFELVEDNQDAEVVVNLDIENFTLWPTDERVSRRRLSRNILVGQDAAGKPVYQTVTATVDIVQIRRRSNARFNTSIAVKGTPGLNFERTFSPNYNYVNTYVDNIQGDARAVDPMLLTRRMGIEPTDDDFLLMLAQQDMIRRLSSELRRYYDRETQTAE